MAKNGRKMKKNHFYWVHAWPPSLLLWLICNVLTILVQGFPGNKAHQHSPCGSFLQSRPSSGHLTMEHEYYLHSPLQEMVHTPLPDFPVTYFPVWFWDPVLSVNQLVVVVQLLSCVRLFAECSCVRFMECSTPGFPVILSQSLLKLMSTRSAMPSNLSSSIVPFSSCPQSFPALGSFPISQLFTSGGQSTIYKSVGTHLRLPFFPC